MADGSPEQVGQQAAPTAAAMRTAFVGVPHSGSMHPEAMASVGIPSLGLLDVQATATGSSLLAFNFNRLWVDALNSAPRPALFAMHHSDIAAPSGWLDTLVQILDEEKADMVSAVVPIKDFAGLTSTGVIDLDADARRRLTVREVTGLPDVFDAKTAGELFGVKRPVLIVNTGLWVCRFDSAWVEEMHFHTGDDIRRSEAGKYRAHVCPEDWMWSMELAARGLKVVATTRVPLKHFGTAPFGLGGPVKPWGMTDGDPWVTM